MLNKRIFVSFFTLLVAGHALAQDKIYTGDGSIQEVKIKEVGTKTIVYKKWSNLEGPDFVILKSEVERIKYQNGDEQSFGRHGEIRPVRIKKIAYSKFGKNIFSFSPVFMTNTSALGFGISYERILDKNSVLSFYLPVAYSFKNNNNSSYNYTTGNYNQDKSTMLWIYPGLKVYPTGSNGIVRYAVGPSLSLGTGNRTYFNSVYDQQTSSYKDVETNQDVFVMGLVINNSLNIQPTPKLHLGLELGLGIPYYTNEKSNNTNGVYYTPIYSDVPLVQFNFNLGYRL